MCAAVTDSPTSTNSSTSAKPGAGRRKADVGPRKRNVVVRTLAAHWLPLVLVIIVAFFIGQNRARISIDLFWAHVMAPLWFVLVITTVVGVIIGVLIGHRRTQRAHGR